VSHSHPTRRELLVAAGGLLAAGTAGCQRFLHWQMTRHDNSVFEPTSYSFEESNRCLMTAEAIDGPYFIERTALRRDVRDGKPGVPLALRLKVVDGESCAPVPAALVEIWHCDAQGVYSGFTDASPDVIPTVPPSRWPLPARDDTRFLRGGQTTDADGFVAFDTIFPGWYSPRVQHVHVKVFTGEDYVLTTQLYFPEDVVAEVEQREPYRQRGPSPYTARNDGVIHDSLGADGGWLRVSGDANGLTGSVTLGVPA
jgi:protocatechuate 3,4-dioxygenase beta subunit